MKISDEKIQVLKKLRSMLKDLYKSKKITKNKYDKLDAQTYTKNITGLKNMFKELSLLKDEEKIKLNLKKQVKERKIDIVIDEKSDEDYVVDFIKKNGGIRKVNSSNYVFTKDTNNTLGFTLLGGYDKLRNFVSQIQKNFIIAKFYDLQTEEYIGEYNLNQMVHTSNKYKTDNSYKGIKTKFSVAWDSIYYSNAYWGLCEFVIRPKVQPKKHQQKFKEAIASNCFMNAIKSALQEGERARESNKINTKITSLNERFFMKGVRYEDIPFISRELNINIIVKNRLNDVIYEDENKRLKTKTVSITSPHIDHVEFIKEKGTEKKDKELVLVDNIDEHYNNNTSSFKYFKKKDDQLLWYYDEDSLYYKNFYINDVLVNEDKYFIQDEFSYYENKFTEENNLNFNIISKNSDPYVFEEINNSVHHLFEHTYNKNLENKIIINTRSLLDVDIDDEDDEYNKEFYSDNNYITYDNNKCFVGFLNDKTPSYKYYNNYKIPCNKYNAYNIDIQLDKIDFEAILEKTAIIKITDIKFNNKVVEELGYFQNNYSYTSAILKYCIDNNIMTFRMTQIIDFDQKQDISFSDDIIKAKHYNKIIGLMSHINDKTSTSFEFKNYDDIADLLYFSSDKVNTYNLDKKIITIQQDNNNIFNKSHISSFILSYAFINILDVVKDVPYDNIINVKCDAVTVKKPLKIVCSNFVGGWKVEQTKKLFTKSDVNTYVNWKNDQVEENKLFSYSKDKINYKRYNFISGGAGCGKTTRFLKKFDSDERLYNSILLLPTNELLYGLQKTYNVPMMTYQSFLTYQHNVSKYNNVILDEVTMIGYKDFKKIIDMIHCYNQNIFVIGDYDISNKKSYQLQPINDDHFYKYVQYLDSKKICYKHLTVNHRQGTDVAFTNFLNSVRGLSNEQIKQLLLSNKMFTKVKYNDVVNDYKLGDKILSSVHSFINKVNEDIKPIDGSMQVLFCKTTNDHAKNETAIIRVEDFNKDIHKVGYCQTAHTSQGQTYNNNVYINLNNLFCDNILYVMISRAKVASQIKLIF
jgi:hypothetical protein